MSQPAKGFFYPRTAEGRANLLPAPPWYYSGNVLSIEFRTDPERVASILPEPLRLVSEDPGAVSLNFAEWQYCSESREELLDPSRAQYMEAYLCVRCEFEGRIYSRSAFIWVDNDAALLRGIQQGYPKKYGSIYMTRTYAMPHGAPRLEAGARLGATLAAGERRLAEAVVTLTGPEESGGFVNAHPLAHHRYLPKIDGAGDEVNELVSIDGPMKTGSIYAATVDELKFLDSPTEELTSLPIGEIIGAHYQEIGMIFDGGTTLWKA